MPVLVFGQLCREISQRLSTDEEDQLLVLRRQLKWPATVVADSQRCCWIAQQQIAELLTYYRCAYQAAQLSAICRNDSWSMRRFYKHVQTAPTFLVFAVAFA